MKQQIKKWALRLALVGLSIVVILLIVILNPGLTYANKTRHLNYTIFHNAPIDSTLIKQLDQVTVLLKRSEFYNTERRLDICLNDGSKYPSLIQAWRGQAFAHGFYNKVVLHGAANFKDNIVELNGYKWNATQLLAHEIIHCMQFDRLGLFKSNPLANIPDWKWEGYPEYIARQDNEQKDLSRNITRLNEAEQKEPNSWGIDFEDNTSVSRDYYRYWLLVQYCMDIKKMTYLQVLESSTSEDDVRQEMMNWYKAQK